LIVILIGIKFPELQLALFIVFSLMTTLRYIGFCTGIVHQLVEFLKISFL